MKNTKVQTETDKEDTKLDSCAKRDESPDCENAFDRHLKFKLKR